MKRNTVIPAVCILAGVAGLAWWLTFDPTRDFKANDVGFDPRTTEKEAEIIIGDKFTTYDGKPSAVKGEWLMFRGPKRDNVIRNSVNLAESWPAEGPKQVWKMKLGEGHSAPAVYNGCFYVLDYNEVKRHEQLRCFNFETGAEIWRRAFKLKMKRNHGFSRTVPAIANDHIVTFGPLSHVMCCDAKTGELKWSKDLVKDYGSKVPFWYGGQCPYIDGNTVVLAPAGTEKLLIGVDLATGEELWSTPNPTDIAQSHSSVMPMTLNGKKMYVYCGIGGMVGVAADGDNAGKVLWQTNLFKASVIAPSPVIFDDGRVYMTAGYGAGSISFKVVDNNGNYELADIKQQLPKEAVASEQQTPVVYEDKMFIIMPKDGGGLRNQLVCTKADNMDEHIYSSGKEKRYGIGPYIVADKKLYILDDDGTLIMADAETDSYKELARHKVLNGHDAWGPLVIIDGRAILRDSKEMICLDLR